MNAKAYLTLAFISLAIVSCSPENAGIDCSGYEDIFFVLSDNQIFQLEIGNGDRQRYADSTLNGTTIMMYCTFRELAGKVQEEYESGWNDSHYNSLYFLEGNLAWRVKESGSKEIYEWIALDLDSFPYNASIRRYYLDLLSEIGSPESTSFLLEEYTLQEKEGNEELMHGISSRLSKVDFYSVRDAADKSKITINLIAAYGQASPELKSIITAMLLRLGTKEGTEFVFDKIPEKIASLPINAIYGNGWWSSSNLTEEEISSFFFTMDKVRNPDAISVFAWKIDFSRQNFILVYALEGLVEIGTNESISEIISALEDTEYDASFIINKTLPRLFGRGHDIGRLLNESISHDFNNEKNRETVISIYNSWELDQI
ncbi:hypothetical protein J4401_06495 [Candidatus Woesearchaeota archaeon]|nr:hypothetical protein [Candidatus Woesearchaeota archaeon]